MMRIDADGTVHTGGAPETISECLDMLQQLFDKRRIINDQIALCLDRIRELEAK